MFFFSNPLKSLQLLDSTFHTARPYLQAFVIHHFNGAITDKIPLINKTKIENPEAATNFDLLQGKYLLVQKGKKNYYLIKVV